METTIRILPPITTRKQANAITGGLSNVSKMPCPSWGLPASTCITGSKLKNIKDTSCATCYARKGFFTSFAKSAYAKRFAGIHHPQWKEAMIWLISHSVTFGSPYFRWFCSGDLQSARMLRDIFDIAISLPSINFWLPTQEQGIVRRVTSQDPVPTNLTIRLSSKEPIDVPPAKHTLPQSMVVTDSPTCPAIKQENQCLDCRKCWDKSEPLIKYLRH